MKNSVALAPEIKQHIERGDYLKLLISPQGKTLQYVDFKSDVVTETYNSAGMYQIFLNGEMPRKDHELYCLFPNHKVEKKQILRVGSYYSLSSLNKDINAALDASLNETDLYGGVKLAICYGKHVFVCRDISGTVYIIWASHVNRTNAGNVASTIHYNVPIVLNFDGQTRLKGIFILKHYIYDPSELERIPITKDNLMLLFPTQESLFVCEVKTPPYPAQRETLLKTVTRKEALSCVLASTKDNNTILKRERNPFAASINAEEDPEFGIVKFENYNSSSNNSNNNEVGIESGTPRTALFFQEINLNTSQTAHTPPILRSDGEYPADPFAEDSSDDK